MKLKVISIETMGKDLLGQTIFRFGLGEPIPYVQSSRRYKGKFIVLENVEEVWIRWSNVMELKMNSDTTAEISLDELCLDISFPNASSPLFKVWLTRMSWAKAIEGPSRTFMHEEWRIRREVILSSLAKK
jgi:hypothetical protein